MKFSKISILLLILSLTLTASPRNSKHSRSVRHSHYPHHYNNHYPYRNTFFGMHYYSPLVIQTHTTTTTTTPQNLVTLTAEMVAQDIVRMNGMLNQGLLSEKEYERGKKTLLNRIGMKINPESSGMSTGEVLDQIEVLHQMHSGQLINRKEFEKQKDKLLALI